MQVAGAGPYDLFGQQVGLERQVGLAPPDLPAPQGGAKPGIGPPRDSRPADGGCAPSPSCSPGEAVVAGPGWGTLARSLTLARIGAIPVVLLLLALPHPAAPAGAARSSPRR